MSFASEQRDYVRSVSHALDDLGIRVFFDENETAAIWGTDGIETLNDVYAKRALRTVMFISEDYVRKSWPTVERRAALSTILEDPAGNRILPVRFDDVEVPGMPSSSIFVRAADYDPIRLADLVAENLRKSGYISGAMWDLGRKWKARAQRVQFSSTADHDGEHDLIRYRIHNGTGSAIEGVVVVVADPGNPECDPENQLGNAGEIVVGVVSADETIDDSHVVRFSESPTFGATHSLGTLLWTDEDDHHWAATGARVQRRPFPARVC